MAPDRKTDKDAPEPGGEAERRREAEAHIRRIHQAWLRGDFAAEDALFAIGDALGLPEAED